MKELRRKFNRFCFEHRNKGIRNLMLYVVLGSALMYVMSMVDPSNALYYLFCFDRTAILQGQVWRLITYPFCFSGGNVLLTVLIFMCYYSLGQAIENIWGTFRFNIFYFTGILLMDIYCMIFGGAASATYLNMSLFLAYATLFPDAQFLIFFIIPVKAWVLALIDLITIILGLFAPFPMNLFPVIALGNYFLFFGKDVLNVLPRSWRVNARRAVKKAANPTKKTIPFHSAGSYEATHTSVKAPYTHKCTVCGRTDISDPDLEFRYCSRCSGYHCYCSDHISNHTHIQ